MASTPERMIALRPATKAERPALDNLMQLYIYDWSELRPLDVARRRPLRRLSARRVLGERRHHPLLLRVDGRLAGFALVSEGSRLTGAPGVFDMAEFFVMRRFRRKGVGLAAAAAAFDRFKGAWEIRQRDENAAATAFWRRAIDRYTGGNYRDVRWNDRASIGPVQMFSS